MTGLCSALGDRRGGCEPGQRESRRPSPSLTQCAAYAWGALIMRAANELKVRPLYCGTDSNGESAPVSAQSGGKLPRSPPRVLQSEGDRAGRDVGRVRRTS